MTRRLGRIRAILAMDAHEATDKLTLRLLAFRRRHRVVTLILDLLIWGASFVMVWWAVSLRAAVFLVAVMAAATIVLTGSFTVVFFVRRHRGRSS